MTNKKEHIILFCIITILFIITRLFRLDSVPYHNGIHVDEWGAAYDAWCIQGWGVDRYLTRFPVFFYNTGQGQNALYIYLAAIMFKLFGFSLFKFRLLQVICASIAYLCLYLLSRNLINDQIKCLIPNALMTITPVFLMSEHWGLESYLLLSFSIISTYLLIKAINSGKEIDFIISGIIWGLTFYTYGVTYVIIPLFMIITLIYLIYVKRIDFSHAIGVAIPVVCLGIPLAIEQFVISGIIGPLSLKYMDFFPMRDFRASDISPVNIPYNLLVYPKMIFVSDLAPQQMVPIFGTIYYISIPFMIIGLILYIVRFIQELRKRRYDDRSIVFLFFIAAQTVALMTVEVEIQRVNACFFPYLMFTSEGIIFVIDKSRKKYLALSIAVVYSITFLLFARWVYSYGENSWCDQTKLENQTWLYRDTLIGDAVAETKKLSEGKKIQMIINSVEDRYRMICLYAGTSPYDRLEEGYHENGYDIGIPNELDLSGDTVYLIEGSLDHISAYLVDQGFDNHVVKSGIYSVLTKHK